MKKRLLSREPVTFKLTASKNKKPFRTPEHAAAHTSISPYLLNSTRCPACCHRPFWFKSKGIELGWARVRTQPSHACGNRCAPSSYLTQVHILIWLGYKLPERLLLITQQKKLWQQVSIPLQQRLRSSSALLPSSFLQQGGIEAVRRKVEHFLRRRIHRHYML